MKGITQWSQIIFEDKIPSSMYKAHITRFWGPTKMCYLTALCQWNLWKSVWNIDGLRTPKEEIAFTAQSKIQSQSQIFRYGQSLFCLPHWPTFSDIFDLCLHWMSVVCGNIHSLFLLGTKMGLRWRRRIGAKQILELRMFWHIKNHVAWGRKTPKNPCKI